MDKGALDPDHHTYTRSWREHGSLAHVHMLLIIGICPIFTALLCHSEISQSSSRSWFVGGTPGEKPRALELPHEVLIPLLVERAALALHCIRR